MQMCPGYAKLADELIVSTRAVVGGCKLALKSPTSVPTAFPIDAETDTFSDSIFGRNPEAVLKVSAIAFSRNSDWTPSPRGESCDFEGFSGRDVQTCRRSSTLFGNSTVGKVGL